jgi:hypothetical protein
MNNQILSDIFALATVVVPAALSVFNALRQAPRFAIIAPLIISAVAGVSLHFRNANSEEKDRVIEGLKGRSLSHHQIEKLRGALSKATARVFDSAGWTV